MERETKKRKMEEIEEQEKHEEAAEEEEEKMELFFALIRSTRDIMHDYVHTRRFKEREGKNIEQDRVGRVVWNPSFEPQDFMEPEFPNNKDITQAAAAATPSGSKKEEEQQDNEILEEQEEEGRGNDIDLKLSL